MRKIYSTLLVACAVGAIGANANDLTTPRFEWANLLQGSTTSDQSIAVIANADGEVYNLSAMGTQDGQTAVTYGGATLYEGTAFAAANPNLTLLKTNADGTAAWVVYSTSGDLANDGAMAQTGDGDVVFAAKMRHTNGKLDQDLSFVDATGASHVIDWKAGDNRSYRMVIGKVSAQGAIKWVRSYAIENGKAPAGTKDNTPDAISVKALAVDNAGNIYVGGDYSMPITFPVADGADRVLTPANTAAWNGDHQSGYAADMLLVKLDANGYFLDYVPMTDAVMTRQTIFNIEYDKGHFYLYGTAQAAEDGTTANLSGVQVTANKALSPFVACLDANLSGVWAKSMSMEGVAGGSPAIQNVGLSVIGDYLWLAGQYNGKITCGDKSVSSVTKSTREGCLIKMEKVNGAWLAAANSRDSFKTGLASTGLTGYYKVVGNPNIKDKVYVWGYVMNKAVGVFLRPYNANDLTADENAAWNLVTEGGVPTACQVAYVPDNNRIYFMARGNKDFTLYDGGTANGNAVANWDLVLASYTIPGAEFTSGVDDIAADNAADADNAAVYDLYGRQMPAGARLAPGVYVKGGKKLLVR